MQALECATRDADRGLPALTLARYALELPELSQLALALPCSRLSKYVYGHCHLIDVRFLLTDSPN